MHTIRLFCLILLFVAVPQWSYGALSPVPVVEIVRVDLPKVEVRISNPSETEACIVWAPGMSWEEQTKWFSLRAGAGGKVWEVRPAVQTYTVNFPKAEAIAPGKWVVRKYDLSDAGRWVLPKGFAAEGWGFEIQAHLQNPRDKDGHRFGVFTGHVTSGWYDAKGRVVEKAGAAEVDVKYAALETRKDFPMQRLLARLEEWKTGTLPDKQSLADFFGADFPWGALEGVSERDGQVVILLPGQQLLKFTFHHDLRGAAKRDSAWRAATELLAESRAQAVKSIVVTRALRVPMKDGDERGAVFKRAFDEKGRMDEKETERIWD